MPYRAWYIPFSLNDALIKIMLKLEKMNVPYNLFEAGAGTFIELETEDKLCLGKSKPLKTEEERSCTQETPSDTSVPEAGTS